jgi:hypothetical protein
MRLSDKSTQITGAKKFNYISVVIYLACLGFKAFYIDNKPLRGIEVLYSGPFGLLPNGSNGMPWFANILLYFAWYFVHKCENLQALVCSLFALALGSYFLLVETILIDVVGPDRVTGYGLGYWLWLKSMLITFLVALKMMISFSDVEVTKVT